MARAARRKAEIGLTAISVEGGLIAPAQIAAIAAAAPSAAEYGAPKGTTLRDEITRFFRIAQAHWRGYSRLENPSAAQVTVFVRGLLSEAFGFDDLTGPASHERGSHCYRIALEARGGRVPVVIAAPLAEADAFHKALPEFGDGTAGGQSRRSPAMLLQDWLNANDGALWGLAFAGDRLRLMRDNASFTRPAWIEVDLGAILRDEMFSDFTALWLLIHASRFGAASAPVAECALERWREAGTQAGTAARERLGENVVDALEALGQGLIEANPDLRDRLGNGQLALPALFEQLLLLVYRLIFLAVAEERGLLHVEGGSPAARLYAENYGFAHLRERASRRAAHDHHGDAWEGMKIVFRGLARGEPILALPALGGLFAPEATPDLDAAAIPNRAFLAAVFRLSWLIERDGRRVRINWRDMATEELGSVYEGLLELVPVLADHGRTFAFAGGAEARGNARKVSGSYYTPDALVQALLDSALNPVLEQAEAEGGADAILALTVIDPACGSAHFLLGAARRMALRVATLRDPDAPDLQAALRDVVRNCIHGVDRNPMAVELAKVALWIETVQPGKPLGFLDANIRCGDALLGVFDLDVLSDGIPDEAYKPLTGDDKETAVWYRKRNKAEREGQAEFDWQRGGGSGLPPARLARDDRGFRALPEDTSDDITQKRERFAARDAGWLADKAACDLYVAAFLAMKTGGVPNSSNSAMIPTTRAVRMRLLGADVYVPLETRAVELAEAARAFHWPLMFPAVMETGGFDVVLGNPPWDVVQLSEEEYFSARAPEISQLSGNTRKKAITELATTRPSVFRDYISDKRQFEASNEFARSSGRYALTARGRINTYALFGELFNRLTSKKGRAGIVIPTGIATSDGTKEFFSFLMHSNRIVSILAFYEVRYWFKDTDDKNSFCLMTIGNTAEVPEFVFDARALEETRDRRRRYHLSLDDIKRINPDSLTAPIFRARGDADISLKLYKNGAGDTRPAEWLRLKQNVFSSSIAEDLQAFTSRESDLSDPVPVYRGASVHQYDCLYNNFDGEKFVRVDKSSYDGDGFGRSDKYIEREYFAIRMNSKRLNPNYNIVIRRIARASDDRTMIACIVPCVATDDTLSIIDVDAPAEIKCCVVANLNSLVLDFACGHKIAGPDIRKHNFSQLPIISRSYYTEDRINYIVPKVVELTYNHLSLACFARDVGCVGSPLEWDEKRRAYLRAQLDAWYAHAYGLTREELRYVLDPKEVMGADYPSETFRVLQVNERRRFGEYRTARLVLAAYDAMQADGTAPAVFRGGG